MKKLVSRLVLTMTSLLLDVPRPDEKGDGVQGSGVPGPRL